MSNPRKICRESALMIVDALRHLRSFGELAQYRYVGFGSVFFVDFSLIQLDPAMIGQDKDDKDSGSDSSSDSDDERG